MSLTEIENFEDDNEETELEEDDKKVKGNKNELITNGNELPLFSDSDKRGLRAADHLVIVKISKPNSGFKGRIPITSTEETIAKLYGNGIYNIEAKNHKHQTLRIREAVEISLPDELINDSSGNPLMISPIRGISEDNERVDRLHDKVTKQVTDNSNQFVQLVTKQTSESAQREREHMASVNQQQQTFFTTMLTATTQMFQQQILLQQQQHQQTLQLLAATQKDKGSDVQMLLAGMAFAKEMMGSGEGESTPPWLQALSQGGDMLSNLVKLSQVKKSNNVKMLKALRAKKKLLAQNKPAEPTSEPSELPKKGIDFDSIFKDTSKEESEVVSEESESDGNIGESDSEQENEDESGEGE